MPTSDSPGGSGPLADDSVARCEGLKNSPAGLGEPLRASPALMQAPRCQPHGASPQVGALIAEKGPGRPAAGQPRWAPEEPCTVAGTAPRGPFLRDTIPRPLLTRASLPFASKVGGGPARLASTRSGMSPSPSCGV